MTPASSYSSNLPQDASGCAFMTPHPGSGGGAPSFAASMRNPSRKDGNSRSKCADTEALHNLPLDSLLLAATRAAANATTKRQHARQRRAAFVRRSDRSGTFHASTCVQIKTCNSASACLHQKLTSAFGRSVPACPCSFGGFAWCRCGRTPWDQFYGEAQGRRRRLRAQCRNDGIGRQLAHAFDA